MVGHHHHHGPTKAWQLQAVGWYLCYFSSQVAVQPFLGAWFARQGLTSQELGLINALTPWISLPASTLWSVLADHLLAHRQVMLVCFVLSAVTRTVLLSASGFAGILSLVLLTQILSSPVGVLADAAVVAACKDNEYGAYRKWGAVGWGCMSTVAGAIIDRFGMGAAFLLHAVLSVPCLSFGWSLHEHQSQQLRLVRAAAQAAANLRESARGYRRLNALEPVKEENLSDLEEDSRSTSRALSQASRVNSLLPSTPDTNTTTTQHLLHRSLQVGSHGMDTSALVGGRPHSGSGGGGAAGGSNDSQRGLSAVQHPLDMSGTAVGGLSDIYGSGDGYGGGGQLPLQPAQPGLHNQLQPQLQAWPEAGGHWQSRSATAGGVTVAPGSARSGSPTKPPSLVPSPQKQGQVEAPGPPGTGHNGGLTVGVAPGGYAGAQNGTGMTVCNGDSAAYPLSGREQGPLDASWRWTEEEEGQQGSGVVGQRRVRSSSGGGASLAPAATAPGGTTDSLPEGALLLGPSQQGTRMAPHQHEEEEERLLLEEEHPGEAGTGGGGAVSTAVPATFVDKLRALLSDRQVVLFLCMTTLLGFGYGTIETFLFVFLQELGANDTLMGLTLTITCAAEVPVFQAQSWLITQWGVDRLLDLVVAVYALRMLCYASLPGWGSPWAVLPVEALHGVTFGLGWGVGTTNCKRLAPPGLATTMQGLFQGCYFGLGYGVGSLVGGFISHRLGFPVMYVCGAVFMGVGWVSLCLTRATLDPAANRWTRWLSAVLPSHWGRAWRSSSSSPGAVALTRPNPAGAGYRRLDMS